jgi:dTDP-4-dehydrorhamnose reductase
MEKKQEPYLVIGSKGMLGTDLVSLLNRLGKETVALDVEHVDITNPDSAMRIFQQYQPRTVINVAALTDVDGCETRIEEAFSINADGAGNLAYAAREFGAFLIHISTDYVFDGSKAQAYIEDDPINPLGIYAKSKAAGEKRVKEEMPEAWCIVRTQWLYGIHGKNFVDAILNLARKQNTLKVVNDQFGAPTYTRDLASAIALLAGLRSEGIFHVTNSGSTSWYEFAVAILAKSEIRHVNVEPISTAQLGRPAPRPLHAVLDNSRYISVSGSPLPHWELGLENYLREKSAEDQK